MARENPRRVVFAEGSHPNMLKAAIEAYQEGICYPILLGNHERIEKLAAELNLSLEGCKVINLRHDHEAERRERYAIYSPKNGRKGCYVRRSQRQNVRTQFFGV
jgi:malate dehydrogenase (oxaloacetate-decarboxylating)(NADP+)